MSDPTDALHPVDFAEITQDALVDEPPMSPAEQGAEALIEGQCLDCGAPDAAADPEGHACPGQ